MSLKKQLQLKALKRNNPAGGDDGGCDEFINAKLEKGAFRPMGPREVKYPIPWNPDNVVHRQDDFENWIGWKNNFIEHYDPVDSAVIQNLGYAGGEIYDIRTLKNFLIVVASNGTHIWLWSDGVYKAIDIQGLAGKFDVQLTPTDEEEPEWTDYSPRTTDPGTIEITDEYAQLASEGLLGLYYKKLNEMSSASRMYGGLTYRVALKLFDGTYVLHTTPRFYRFYHHDMLFEQGGVLAVRGGIRMRFGGAGVAAKAIMDITEAERDIFRDLVSSVEIFFSAPEQFYDVSDKTINREFVDTMGEVGWENNQRNARDLLPISDGFKSLVDQPAFYLAGTVELGTLSETSGRMEGVMEMDMEDYYQNYATRKLLPVDGFTHHKLTGKASYVYNNRLVLGNLTQFLGAPDILQLGSPAGRFGDPTVLRPISYDPVVTTAEYQFDKYYTAKAVVYMNTDNGEKVLTQTFQLAMYQNPLHNRYKLYLLEALSGYFDERAYKLQILISQDVGLTFKQSINVNLTKSKYFNFSYIPYGDILFSKIELAIPDYPTEEPKYYGLNLEGQQFLFDIGVTTNPDVDPPAEVNEVRNSNTRSVSEVSNPLVFDPLNYQDVSTGTIIAFGSNTDPISDSQFGSYPLYNFTSVGIWASIIGTGETFITNDVPVNGEVLLSPKLKQDLSLGTVYASLEGLRILSGREPVEISVTAEGDPEYAFTSNSQLQEFLNLPQTVDVSTIVDQVPFKTFLEGAVIGYSKGDDDENIFLANKDYDYVYMFDMDTKLWSKMSGNIINFINYYPELYGIATNGMVNMSKSAPGTVPVYFHTKPLSLDGHEVFKKLRRTFLRGFINTAPGKFAAFYVFGSDDLINWSFVTGNDRNSGAFSNIWCTHSVNSKRFYVFVFAAELDVAPNKPNWINGIEVELDYKWDSKGR